MKKEFANMLNNISKDSPSEAKTKRILLLDGLNLFFRNFAVLNMIHPSSGEHIGGVGGFLRSLGATIRNLQADEVYVIFDGEGSTINRKNLLPEYKSNRNHSKITNWDVFDDLDEENESKVNQIIRVIQYLKLLPVKILLYDKCEADDIIAYLSNKFSQDKDNQVFIVSSDQDFIQLVKPNVIFYKPTDKVFYTESTIIDKFGVLPQNFILYKVLLGDSSDQISGVKGLGKKGITKKFPQLKESILSLDDIFSISETKMKDNIVYARICKSVNDLEKSFKVMDLSSPMISQSGIQYINNEITKTDLPYHPNEFIQMYNDDNLGNLIRNVRLWLKEIFEPLKK